MASKRPSKTTATGARPADPGCARPDRTGDTARARRAELRQRVTGCPGRPRSAAALAPILATFALTTVVVVALSLAGCSSSFPLAQAGDRLAPGRTISADLDGDGTGEEVTFSAEDGSLVITDGPTVYRSRDKWRVVDAFVGDTDGNGLLEITALLDADDGRHLGLFARMGDRYRERLVTSVLTPRPLSLRVIPADDGPYAATDGQGAAVAPDLVVLTEESRADESPNAETAYRWNGFGFTAVDKATP